MARILTLSRSFIPRPHLVLLFVGLLCTSSAVLIRTTATDHSANANGNVSDASRDQLQQPTQIAGRCPTCAPPKTQVIYAPLFDLPEASHSEIVLNCRSAQVVAVTPTFYTLDGTPYVGDVILLQPSEIRFVDTKSLIPEPERNRHKWGGISFSYVGNLMEAWAQLTLHGVHGGGSVNVVFTVLGQSRSNTSEAVWWVPRNGTALIALGNSSDQQIHANLSFSNGETLVAEIAPYATEVVRRTDDGSGQPSSNLGSNGRGEAVSITYTGPTGSLIPAGVTSSGDGKFASMIRFYNPAGVVQPHLYANSLRLKNAALHMVLRNTSPDSLLASPRFLTSTGSAKDAVRIPQVKLGPYQVREVDLRPLVRAAASRSDLESVVCRCSIVGRPGV